MTTLDNRPDTLPATREAVGAVIDGEVVARSSGRNPRLVSMVGATGCVPIAVTGLIHTALTQPEYIGLPIVVTLAITVTAAVNALRHDLWASRNPS